MLPRPNKELELGKTRVKLYQHVVQTSLFLTDNIVV